MNYKLTFQYPHLKKAIIRLKTFSKLPNQDGENH